MTISRPAIAGLYVRLRARDCVRAALMLRMLVLVLVLWLLAGCAAQPGPLTAVVAAYPGELDGIVAQLGPSALRSRVEINGTAFRLGKVAGHRIVVFETGIGLTNAAMTTQLALDRFDIRRLLFAGVAGGLDPALTKGDVSIPARWHYYEYGARFTRDPNAPSGYRIPEFMRERIGAGHLDNFFPYPMRVTRQGEPAAPQPYFEADPELLDIARAAIDGAGLVNTSGAAARVQVGGVGGSGFAFNDDAEMAAFIRSQWGSATVDMESAAIAQVCWSNRIPFLQIRSVSDIAGNENPNEFAQFKAAAEGNAGRVLVRILRYPGLRPAG